MASNKYKHGTACLKCKENVTDHKSGVCKHCRVAKCKKCSKDFKLNDRRVKLDICPLCFRGYTTNEKIIISSGMI